MYACCLGSCLARFCADALLSVQGDPEWTAEKELCMRRGMPYAPPKQKENIEDEEYMSAEAGALSVGERCEVDPGGKRGVIRSEAASISGTTGCMTM